MSDPRTAPTGDRIDASEGDRVDSSKNGGAGSAGRDDAATPTSEVDAPSDESRPDDHLANVADGCGCAEVWEHLSEHREGERREIDRSGTSKTPGTSETTGASETTGKTGRTGKTGKTGGTGKTGRTGRTQ